MLLVNTASDCGFTAQYDDLQKVQDQFNNLQVIGFPSNDFKQQEKGTDEEIGAFCRKNFGITFPLASRSIVIKSARQNEVYQWLTDKKRNGWNNQQPTWNFSKYLVDEQGRLINFFSSAVTPLSDDLLGAIQK